MRFDNDTPELTYWLLFLCILGGWLLLGVLLGLGMMALDAILRFLLHYI